MKRNAATSPTSNQRKRLRFTSDLPTSNQHAQNEQDEQYNDSRQASPLWQPAWCFLQGHLVQHEPVNWFFHLRDIMIVPFQEITVCIAIQAALAGSFHS